MSQSMWSYHYNRAKNTLTSSALTREQRIATYITYTQAARNVSASAWNTSPSDWANLYTSMHRTDSAPPTNLLFVGGPPQTSSFFDLRMDQFQGGSVYVSSPGAITAGQDEANLAGVWANTNPGAPSHHRIETRLADTQAFWDHGGFDALVSSLAHLPVGQRVVEFIGYSIGSNEMAFSAAYVSRLAELQGIPLTVRATYYAPYPLQNLEALITAAGANFADAQGQVYHRMWDVVAAASGMPPAYLAAPGQFELLPEVALTRYGAMSNMVASHSVASMADNVFRGELNENGWTIEHPNGTSEFVTHEQMLVRNIPFMRRFTADDPSCFAAGTPVLMADGTERAIEDVVVGDRVMAFDGFRALEPREVLQLHRNWTTEFIDLGGCLITPGHHVLDSEGMFRPVVEVLRSGSGLVRRSGEVVRPDWRLLEAAAVNGVGSATAGGWPTYNLSIEGLETYVAAGWRVHNTSILSFFPAGAIFVDGPWISSDGQLQIAEAILPDGSRERIVGGDVNGDGNTDVTIRQRTYPDGRRVTGRIKDGQFSAEVIDAVTGYNWTTVHPLAMGEIMRTVGSALGSFLGNGDPLASIAASSLLGTIGRNIGQAMDLSRPMDASAGFLDRLTVASADFGTELGQAVQGAVIGSVSSLLALELGNLLDLDGFGAELFQTTTSTVLGQVLNNAVQIAQGASSVTLFSGFNTQNLFGNVVPMDAVDPAMWNAGILSSAIGAFLGAKLGSMVVSPQTQAGVLLSSIGSATGAFMFGMGAAHAGSIGTFATALASKLGSIGNFVVPGIGAFVGFVLGALIGNLFGRKKPKIPTANAEVYLDYTTDRFELGGVITANGGDLAFVRDMALTAQTTLNGFMDILAGEMPYQATSWAGGLWRNGRLVSTDGGVQTFYGHTGGQVWVKLGGAGSAQVNVASPDEALSRGVLWSLDQTHIIGGDILAKRALANSPATELTGLLGDLKIAEEYGAYMRDRASINGMIAANPESAFAAAHMAMLARVDELKINTWAVSDFRGGLQGFLMSFRLDQADVALENIQVSTYNGLRIDLPTNGNPNAGPLSLLGQSQANGWSVIVDDLTKIGYGWSYGVASQGNEFADFRLWGSSVTFNGLGGDDIVNGGYANDYLYGGQGWDWLSGGDGNDVIEGGEGNDVLIGGLGSDNLFGQAGDDYLSGGEGDDVMDGGDGADILVAGIGNDYVSGGAGDDKFIVERDARWGVWETSASFYGGSGSDTLSFDRYRTGQAKSLSGQWTLAHNAASAPQGGITGIALSMLDFPAGATDAGLVGTRLVVDGIENVSGSRLNDYLVGDVGSNRLFGGAGDDILDGHTGDDILEGGAGADFMITAGIGTLSYETSNGGVQIYLATGQGSSADAHGDRWTSMENVSGSRFGDELKGDDGVNVLQGMGGDDWLLASRGADTVDGGDGADTADFSGGGFVTGVSTYQVWVNDGYWEWDDWLQQNVWVDNGGHYESVTGTVQGLSVNLGANSATLRTADGQVHTQTVLNVEHLVGTAGDDTIVLGAGDEFVTGGAGHDVIHGASGADTYFFGRGDGFDYVYEDNLDNNTLSLSGDVLASDLSFGIQSGAVGFFDVMVGSPNDRVRFQGNFAVDGNNRLKTIDLNGAGQIDVSAINSFRNGGGWGDTIYGAAGASDLITSYGGGDMLYGAGAGGWESQGNIFIGGADGDSMVGSVGDDQYVFEDSDSWDIIIDAGGDDTLVFGASVLASSVMVTVEDDDMMVYYNGGTNRIRIKEGANRYIDAYTGQASWNTIEYINAGGTWIDIRKLDIPWIDYQTFNGAWAPIVFDLAGDGLNLVSIDQSQIVSQLDSGKYARTGWVGPTDGMLAYDRDGNGRIDRLEEISFVGDVEGAKTDLEGLRSWDTNGDEKLNALDEGWSKLKVWVDRNQNGRSTGSELRGLEEAGIVEIDLISKATGFDPASTRDNYVHNTLGFIWADGARGEAFDVALARRLLQDRGLSAEEVRAAWGDGKSGGILGRLLNDPASAAALARQVTDAVARSEWIGAGGMMHLDVNDPDTSRDVTGRPALPQGEDVSLDDINDAARVDFSDHDDRYAEEEARWLDQLLGRTPERLERDGRAIAADETVFVDRRHLPANGLPRGGAFQRPVFTNPRASSTQSGGVSLPANLDDRSAADTPFAPIRGVIPPPLTVTPTDLDSAAALLAADGGVANDAWGAADFTLAAGRAAATWWEKGRALSFVAERVPVSDALPGFVHDPAPVRVPAGDDAATLSAHQKLTQAMAAFGPRSGAGAAVWTRGQDFDPGADTAVDGRSGRWRFGAPARMSA